MRRVHIIGAGLAGLAAALSLSEAGWAVTLYEAGPAAGGRCRSFFDKELDCRIDNGNHLLLSGNDAAFGFLRQVGAAESMIGPATPEFPFMDLASGERWTVRPNMGRIPWWLLNRSRRVPGATVRDILALARLGKAGDNATVAEALPHGALYRKLIEPLAISALNTMPQQGSAKLLQAVIEGSLAAGGAACLPRYPAEGLSESFIDPAIRYLEARNGRLETGVRIANLTICAGRVTALGRAGGDVMLGADDYVVLATPAPVATTLLPGIQGPTEFESIANLHFRYASGLPGGFIGLIGGLSEWIFIRNDVISVTISAANRYADRENCDIVATVWQEICRALQLESQTVENPAIPPYRLLREKRATFLASPVQDRLRPGARTDLANLALAGDWTATALPSTIEGAIRSGRSAAKLLLELT